MEYQKEKITARERLEEATVAIFMDRYAQALDAGIDRKIEECAGDAFPEELDNRCRALIEQANRKAKNKKRIKSALRVLRSAAVVTVVLVGLFSVLFVSVEAFRIPILNFFIEKTDRYWEITATPKEAFIPIGYDPEDPLGGIIGSFTLTSLTGSVESGDLLAIYNLGDDIELALFADYSFGNIRLDGEDYAVTEITVAGHTGQMYAEGDRVNLAWLDENIDRIFVICTQNIAEEAVMQVAEEFARYFD